MKCNWCKRKFSERDYDRDNVATITVFVKKYIIHVTHFIILRKLIVNSSSPLNKLKRTLKDRVRYYKNFTGIKTLK